MRPRNRKTKTCISIRRGETEYLLMVEGVCLPGRPAKTYGDPDDCYPADPGSVEDIVAIVDEVIDGDISLEGKELELNDEEYEIAVEALMEKAAEDEAEAEDRAIEYYIDQKRERELLK